MNKLGSLAAAFFLVFSLFSCDQDIDLTADWENIPIVYGLLNPGDTAHYIRVEKAFQDQEGNAYLAALEPDSIYYSAATVRLRNMSTGQEALLEKVDGAAEGYPRDSGLFAQLPNYLYKVRSSDFLMEGGDVVLFSLERGENLPEVTAECTILDEIIPLGGITPGSKIDFPENRDVLFRWRAGDEARVFDLCLVIHYDEKLAGDPAVRSYLLEFPMAKRVKRDDSTPFISTKVYGLEFFKFLAEHIEARTDATRVLTGMDFVITGGGEAIEQYIAIALANTGITSAQEIPTYSNLSEGRGIFSSIVRTSVPGLLLSDASKDYLLNSELTEGLNFQ